MSADDQCEDSTDDAANCKCNKLRIERRNTVFEKVKGAEPELPRPCLPGGHFTASLSPYQ